MMDQKNMLESEALLLGIPRSCIGTGIVVSYINTA